MGWTLLFSCSSALNAGRAGSKRPHTSAAPETLPGGCASLPDTTRGLIPAL